MKNKKEIESKLKALKPALYSKFHVEKIGYFGSYATGKHTGKSDIDILVQFRRPVGWAFFDLRDLLESELNLKIDLVSIKALKVQLRDAILSQVKYV